MSWFVYILECKDGSLYTGITTNIKIREHEHNTDDKLGAKSLKGKLPVKVVYYESYLTQSDARKREAAIKQWKREYKLKLIKRSTIV